MSPSQEPALLWALFKRGDWEAYTTLYNQHTRLLLNYGHKFTRDRTLIEDAVHDLFIKLWTNRATLGTPLSVKNYLYKALRSILFRKLAARSRFTEMSDGDPLGFEVSFDQLVIANEEEQALQTKITKALATPKSPISWISPWPLPTSCSIRRCTTSSWCSRRAPPRVARSSACLAVGTTRG
jgi:hypothetical protein